MNYQLTKTLKVMKLIAILLFAACLHASARSWGQSITLSLKNAPLEKVFGEVTRQTGYSFIYTRELLDHTVNIVDLDVKDAPLDQVLQRCFAAQPLTYTIEQRYIIIKPRPQTPVLQSVDSSRFPPGEIHGRVTNAQGQPLENANVIIKRSHRGTTTNPNGEFVLRSANANDELIITFTGYKALTVKVNGGKEFPLVMQVSTAELDKVVIQAYGTTSQRLTTSDISTVTSEQIERQPVMNPLAALQGQVPGLIITQDNGYASSPFKVEIRGRSVINASLSSEPLYVIDGVPLTLAPYGSNGNYAVGSPGFTQNGFLGPAGGQSPLFSINPSDIESVSVLKDADATAIYGSRGANGVILITTKSGKPGKAKFEANVYQGESVVTNHYKLMNTPQYLSMRREAFRNDNISMNTGNAYDLLQWDTTRYTDWQKLLWGSTGKVTDVQMAVSGGDKQTTFRLSGDYHRQTSILTRNGADQRSDVQININHKSLDQKIRISFTSAYSYTTSNLVTNPSTVLIEPDAPAVFNSHGQLNYAGWGTPYSSPWNDFSAFAGLLQPYTASTGFLNSKVSLQYEVIKGLILAASVGYSTYNNQQKQLTPIASQDLLLNPTGMSQFGNNYGNNTIAEPTIEYKTVVSKGKLDVLAGATDQTASNSGDNIIAQGFTNDALLGSVGNATSKIVTNGSGQYKYAAIYARLNFNWSDEYVVNLSARRDGSSLFGPGHQFGNFGSVGVAWIFTEEAWIKRTLPFLSFGKLRGSYGTTGSDQIPAYQYLSQWTANGIAPYQQGGSPAYNSILLANPNLVWQSNHKLEGAVDLGFLKDRLLIEVARYQDRCGNQLVPYILPLITGFSSVTANLDAVVQNTGWESTIKYKVVDTKSFSAAINFNIGINRNKLISFPGLAQSSYAAGLTVGKSLNIHRLLHLTGIDPQTGQYSFEDQNHDGMLTNYYNNGINDLFDKDLSVKFDGGAGLDLGYKNFQLNLFFQFRNQELPSAIYSGTIPGTVSQSSNQSVKMLNHWQRPGDNAQYARYSTTGTINDFIYSTSDGDYSNGAYVRLKNLSLSYNIPESARRKWGIQACKVYVRGENLWLISKYDGIDPDTPGLGLLPPSKTFTAGLQLTL
jgi:TonB-linked SusC/RagA family outer membrane protein